MGCLGNEAKDPDEANSNFSEVFSSISAVENHMSRLQQLKKANRKKC